MYRVSFSFVFMGFLCVCGQNVKSPCPQYFDYKSDNTGLHGFINLQPFGFVPSLLVRANFTIAARLPSTYAGNLHPIGSELYLLQEFNRGVPLQYRVNFPVISPVPKLTALTVNDNVLCYGTGDVPGEAAYVTTISLQHMLFFKSGTDGLYAVINTPSQAPSYEIEPEQQTPPQTINNRPQTNFNINNNQVEGQRGDEAPKRPGERPGATTTQRPIRPTTRKTWPVKPSGAGQNSQQPGGTLNALECGINGGAHDHIPLVYNGFSYDRGEWPWLVALYKRKFSSLSYICAGTLVSEKHVVSAAHCMQRKSSYTSIKNIVVKAGVYNLEDWSDDITVTRTLTAAAIHDAYNASSLANDILVMTLDKNIPLSNFIKPACLWSGSTDLNRIVGQSGVVAGWGANEMGPGGKGEPRMVRMPIVSTATCRASKPEFHKLTSSKTLCAGDHSGSGPCLGDSGGGLYILDNGRWRLRGVVSLSLWTENGESTCNLEDYVVFTDTAQYLPWITDVMTNTIN
ncbi:serine protease gd-like isoform X2 [Nymphalis io]|uniref:serine protease gd-like isoform X2 n=1 Tax=Inachis io TaxID=171585 RepID=UPI002166E1C6|nr:serine protease gd-like isoform X2 [Nymphalis io]